MNRDAKSPLQKVVLRNSAFVEMAAVKLVHSYGQGRKFLNTMFCITIFFMNSITACLFETVRG